MKFISFSRRSLFYCIFS